MDTEREGERRIKRESIYRETLTARDRNTQGDREKERERTQGESERESDKMIGRKIIEE